MCYKLGHYYLEHDGTVWIASDHWGVEVARHSDKEQVRKLAEVRGYQRFR